MKRNLSIVLLVAGLLLSACGSESESASTEPEPTTATTTTVADSPSGTDTTRSGGDGGDTDACEAFVDLAALSGAAEEIATGAFEGQVSADQAWSDAIEQIRSWAPDDGELLSALDTLGGLSFQVTDSDDGPSSEELEAALATLDAAYGDYCDGGPVECPAPETLSDLGLECDAEGQLTPADGEPSADGVLGPVDECPAPEVLEENGYTCDSEGYLTPVG